MGEEILKLDNIAKYFPLPNSGFRKVLQNVSLVIRAGEIMGLTGPSGSGKSTLARIILGIEKPDRGNLFFKGDDLYHKLTIKKRRAHFRNVQMIWQDPAVYLNPYQCVLNAVLEPLRAFKIGTSQLRRQRAFECMRMTGLETSLARLTPRQLSGGQCQRVAIARALSIAPHLLICDEALVSLDLPQQVAILKLLKRLQRDLRLAILFISHDQDTVNSLCTRIVQLSPH